MELKYTAPPHMHDRLPFEPETDAWRHVARWRALESAFRDTARIYGFREIRTPVIESTELFERSLGQASDIVGKEMYTFRDKGDRSMTMRAEGTAPVIRAYLEHGIANEGAVNKLYYIATIYRFEGGQRGRYREHQQTGVEVLGAADPAVDAEVISLADAFYKRLGIEGYRLMVNSVGCPICRPAYRDRLVRYAEPLLGGMSEDNQRRFRHNPLRMLDSKDDRDRRLMADAPTIIESLCDDCAGHFGSLQKHLGSVGVGYDLNPRLVRGLDYYTRTAFEFVSAELGEQTVIGGGGRYDGLVEECGGPPTPGIGFGVGTERCLLALECQGKRLALDDERPFTFVVALGDEARDAAVGIVQRLRAARIATGMDYIGRSMKAQMRVANKSGAPWTVVIGSDELARGIVGLKDMHNSTGQTDCALADLPSRLAAMGGVAWGGAATNNREICQDG